jgi:hypothetical protein
MKVKFLKGWLKVETMENICGWAVWLKEVIQAEKEDCELVIFKIPKNKDAIAAIEKMLQDRFC